MKEDIVTADLTNIVETAGTVENKIEVFEKTLTKIMDSHAPLRTKIITIRPSTEKSKLTI